MRRYEVPHRGIHSIAKCILHITKFWSHIFIHISNIVELASAFQASTNNGESEEKKKRRRPKSASQNFKISSGLSNFYHGHNVKRHNTSQTSSPIIMSDIDQNDVPPECSDCCCLR